jgi:uncharacterized protein
LFFDQAPPVSFPQILAPAAADDEIRKMSVDGTLQEGVFRFLGDRSTHGGATVERVDTHSAVVFLAGDRVLKIKRAVRFPFLDYSTLDKRKAACSAELEINRKFAPQLYRRIVPITRDQNGALSLGGAGEPIEWAVEMARFDENKTLDHLADRGELDEKYIEQLAASVAAMHDRAEPVAAGPWIKAVEDFVKGNTAAFKNHGDLFPLGAVEQLEQKSLAAFARLRPLLVERGRQGLIRRGHGDLHLGNIAVLDGKPVAFDALEFDPVVATGDVLYDLAFLLMDLAERGFHDAANRVLNGYFSATRRIDDCDGIAALPFFMSLRAAIRAMVTVARLDLTNKSVAASAKRYFHFAIELLQPAKPIVVCIGGLSGTGKTVLARSLAPAFAPVPGALVFRSDVERKVLFGVAEHDRLPPEAYRPEMSNQVYDLLFDKAERVSRAGYPAIVDAVFAKPQERSAIERAVAGKPFCGLFLVADLPARLQRVGARKADASDADAEVARQQEQFAIGPLDWETIDASGTPEETLAKARAALARHM